MDDHRGTLDVRIEETRSVPATLHSIDLPICCSNPMTAVGMLGGWDRVTAACKGESRKLQFSFRPGDNLGIPLPSQPKAPSSRLLLRIRVKRDRRTGDVMDEGRGAKVEVVGVIGHSFCFTALADFQYLTLSAFHQPDTVSKKRLETVPAAFVPVSSPPGCYNYTSGKPSGYPGTMDARKYSKGCVIRFGQPVPSSPPAYIAGRKRREAERYTAVQDKIQDLYDKSKGGRDMWQRSAVEANFKGTESYWAFSELIRVVAYNISNGPYRGIWVRYGYDPMKEPLARFYQVIDVRWKESMVNKLRSLHRQAYLKLLARRGEVLGVVTGGTDRRTNDAAAPMDVDDASGHVEGGEGAQRAGSGQGEGAPELKIFGRTLRRQMVFQLVDLGDRDLQEKILSLPRKATCTMQGGWFRFADLTTIRSDVKKYVSRYVTNCFTSRALELTSQPALTPQEIFKLAERNVDKEVIVDETEVAKPPRKSRKSSGGAKAGKERARVLLEEEGEEADEEAEGDDEEDGDEAGDVEKGDVESFLRLNAPVAEEDADEESRAAQEYEAAANQAGDGDDIGGAFSIPLTPGGLLNVNSIRLLGLTSHDAYPSSDEDSSDESEAGGFGGLDAEEADDP